jgi:hypothetical protein
MGVVVFWACVNPPYHNLFGARSVAVTLGPFFSNFPTAATTKIDEISHGSLNLHVEAINNRARAREEDPGGDLVPGIYSGSRMAAFIYGDLEPRLSPCNPPFPVRSR